ncbi:hypothetical protein PHYPO_G00242390 [Pangasianodon hypophthalmus]|uniref:Uncharacterized protein n=1 Tax=Pangasianodon hypophthalmus TaxID=310915 RepID=A0A5N5NG67_PANHP|nr:hypothetical protein PHYPO_G00242390 [Pangasianodon hypophthalmus]
MQRACVNPERNGSVGTRRRFRGVYEEGSRITSLHSTDVTAGKCNDKPGPPYWAPATGGHGSCSSYIFGPQ